MEKESTNLENTGNNPLTACQPQTPWRKTYLPLPRSDFLFKRFQSNPLTQSWSQLFHSSVFIINYLNILFDPRDSVFPES
ncbi:hypothetical protein AMECASPLE_027351 [Ameca splendens]|uniref:Uncharacterized protein n=1 Tax=Ameca splendens TaxID=208324 RepID=A0ABV0ZRZ2_9TELE